jgi:hypothetical protein
MRKGALVVFAIFARFSLDSARTKIPMAKMAASQKINRAALDIFITVGPFFIRQHWGISLCRNALTLHAQSPEFAQAVANNASRIFGPNEETFDLSVIRD